MAKFCFGVKVGAQSRILPRVLAVAVLRRSFWNLAAECNVDLKFARKFNAEFAADFAAERVN